MGRVSPAFATALGEDVIYPSLFAEFQFESGTSRFWTGDADITWNSETWTASAFIGSVETSGEGEELEARQLVFKLNSVDRSFYAVAINTQYRNRPVKLWFNLLNSAGTSVEHSYLLEEARMDKMNIEQNSDTLTLVLSAESRLLNLFKPNRTFMTPSDHKKLYPTDDFYKFVQGLPGSRLPWGLEGALGSKSTTQLSRPGWGGAFTRD